MYNIRLNHVSNAYDFNELIKIFLPPAAYRLAFEAEKAEGKIVEINEGASCDKNEIKRELYRRLADLTGKKPPWGILTGVRPVKLAGELAAQAGSSGALEILKRDYLLQEEKARLLVDIYEYQQQLLGAAEPASLGVYVGIPFCPTRCLYCSFTSNQQGAEEIEKYLEALLDEIEYCGRAAAQKGMRTESVYIGGGTPTTLSAAQLDRLLTKLEDSFDLDLCREFTVEAGRPDTITAEKLAVISSHGIRRISINPQTMKDQTLALIGRRHSAAETRAAFALARERGDFLVNADVIAGLPGENEEDFAASLAEIIALDPCNITVHTLAVKKASRLIEADEDYHYKQAAVVAKMLARSKELLSAAGYRPYYLYRQKHMAGALENVGYCRDDEACIYNIRIMDEHQSILAMGAGGISKKYYPQENRLERVPNVSNYQVYIERLAEMLARKESRFFEEV